MHLYHNYVHKKISVVRSTIYKNGGEIIDYGIPTKNVDVQEERKYKKIELNNGTIIELNKPVVLNGKRIIPIEMRSNTSMKNKIQIRGSVRKIIRSGDGFVLGDGIETIYIHKHHTAAISKIK